MNGHIWEVFRYELSRNLRRKGYLFTTFGVPVLGLVILLAYQFLVAGGTITLPDFSSMVEAPGAAQDNSEVKGLVDETGLFGAVDSLRLFDDEASATAALEAGEINTYYIIPADYIETGEVIQVMPTLQITEIDENTPRQLIFNVLGEGIAPAVLNRLNDPSNFERVNVQREEPTPADFDTSFAFIYPFAIALMLSLFMTNGYLMQGVIEEKESRVVEILMSSVRPGQLLVGKILAFGVLGLVQLLVWVGAMVLVLEAADFFSAISILGQFSLPAEALPLMLVYFVLAYLLFASAYGILGALSVSMREGPQFAVVFTLPAVAPLWFSSMFITMPDAPLVVGLSLFPLTAPLSMMQRVLLTTVPAWQIIVSLALLALTIVGAMWLAGRVFRVQTLLAGQLPKLRDLPRLVRG